MTQIITATKEQERKAADKAVIRLSGKTLGPSIAQAAADVKEKAEIEAADKFAERNGEIEQDEIIYKDGVATLNLSDMNIRQIQMLNPVPEELDPFTEALLGGVDPMAAHQALTLTFPIMAFLGHNIRVLYEDGTLRWMCGQSWQMGGSGCGKSLVLRELENLFLSEEKKRNAENAQKAAAYSLLSEKERKETNMPEEEVRIMDSVPTALALLQQMQINGGGAMYLSCSECGEFGKKIKGQYYALVLDMMKKSYDGTGESYMHKTNSGMYYVPSMKLCCNIGGTIDPMYGIFRQCDSDGTLSRGAVTMLGERKDEKKDGPYKSPDWTKEQVEVLLRGAMRLRNFNNTFNENDGSTGSPQENENLNLNDNDDENEKINSRIYEGARDSEGNIPSLAEYNISMQKERIARALNIPAFQALGREIKRYLVDIGEIADDCCSRANERAMALCYLLYVANGLYEDVPESEKDETMRRIVDVARWWVRSSIDCAIAVQKQLNINSKSQRESIRNNYKEVMGASGAQKLLVTRAEALRKYEAEYTGEQRTLKEIHDDISLFRDLSLKQTQRIIDAWGWKRASYAKYLIPMPSENDGSTSSPQVDSTSSPQDRKEDAA